MLACLGITSNDKDELGMIEHNKHGYIYSLTVLIRSLPSHVDSRPQNMRQTKLIEMKLPNLRPRIPTKDQVVARCTSIEAWQLPKQSSSIAPETVWSNAGKPDSLYSHRAVLTPNQIKTRYRRNSRPGVVGLLQCTGSAILSLSQHGKLALQF